MDPGKYLNKRVHIEFVDGQVLDGFIYDYTTSADNDDAGEYFGI